MKVIINRCFGGFSLSPAVMAELGLTEEHHRYGYLSADDLFPEEQGYVETLLVRSHPRLLAAVEKVGIDKAAGDYARLEIVEIPDEAVEYAYVHDYDGSESVVWSLSPIHHA
jgi:hypothetical protein